MVYRTEISLWRIRALGHLGECTANKERPPAISHTLGSEVTRVGSCVANPKQFSPSLIFSKVESRAGPWCCVWCISHRTVALPLAVLENCHGVQLLSDFVQNGSLGA